MGKERLLAFSDGVIAILITIMVLELKTPEGGDWHSLRPLLPVLASYALSFLYLGIYWNNHHHLLHTAQRVNGKILWANLHLLFWLSLQPFVTGWMGRHGREHAPAAAYGVVLLLSAIAFTILQQTIRSTLARGSILDEAVGRDVKGKVSMSLYAAGIGAAFITSSLAQALFVIVALIWLVPDSCIERRVSDERSL